MKWWSRLIGIAAFISSGVGADSAWARVDGFWVWEPEPKGIRYLLPKIPGIDPAQFARRLQSVIKTSDRYGSMENAQSLRLSTGPEAFREFQFSSADRPDVAVVLNRPNQMTKNGSYLRVVTETFESRGVNLYSIPVGLELAMSASDMHQFQSHLNQMKGMLGVGGDDVHPNAYGSRDLSEVVGDICLMRDRAQMSYMRQYRLQGRGRVLFICGSMQRAAVDDGWSMNPDINRVTSERQSGAKAPVLREVAVDPDSELAAAAGKTRFMTSNYHHASVDASTVLDPARPPTSRITAFNVQSDGTIGEVVKAIEFPRNQGLGVQFHPEFLGSPEEKRIVDYMVEAWRQGARVSPQRIVSCMLRRVRDGLTPSGQPKAVGDVP